MKPTSFTSRVMNLMLTAGMLAVLIPSVASAIEICRILSGKVWVKSEGASILRQVSIGEQLKPDDWLKTDDKTVAFIHCSSNYEPPVSTSGQLRIVSYYCPNDRPGANRGSLIPPPVRGGIDSSIPYIISPRYTLLLSDKPMLRWNAVQGATGYTVRVYRSDTLEDVLVWQTQVNGTEVAYAGEQPLEPEVDYLLVVEANNGRSSQQEEKVDYPLEPNGRRGGLQFRRISKDEIQKVQVLTDKITKLKLTQEEEAIFLANEYAHHLLFAEAIEKLEALVKGGTKTPAVYRTLGDLYGATGLNRLAEKKYLQAIELADAKQDLVERAAAKAGLGTVYEFMNTTEAIRVLQEAQAEYQAFGDKNSAQQIKEKIETISSP